MIEKLDKSKYESILSLAKIIKQNFEISMIGPNDKIIVYKIDDKIVAFLQYSVLYETVDILNICVLPDYRRRHIGTELLNYIVNLPIENIMLEVRKSNKTAINFYEKNGFKVIRTIKKYYDNEDGLSMERSV